MAKDGGTNTAVETVSGVPDTLYPNLTNADVKNVSTYDEAVALLGGDVVTFNESGDWDVLEDKTELVGVPFVVLRWRFNDTELGKDKQYVSVEVITGPATVQGVQIPGGRRLVINDGSTGIYAQLKAVTEATGRTAGGVCRKGLRVSEYDYVNQVTGETTPARTFYLT